MAKGNFWLGGVVGFVIMVLIGEPLPVLGPIVGGFVAGIFGALMIPVAGMIAETLFAGLFGLLIALGIGAILIVTALYFAVLGLAGGALGGFIGG
jgi:hypothetical protein